MAVDTMIIKKEEYSDMSMKLDKIAEVITLDDLTDEEKVERIKKILKETK
jgi:hypothetical protein